jgi:glucose-6-phosphate isomerase
MQIKHNPLYCDDNFWKELKPYSELANKRFKNFFQDGIEESPNLGWFSWPQKHGFELLETIQKEISSDIKEFYDCVVVVGIGGSYLGTAAIYDLLSSFDSSSTSKNLPLFFLGNNLSENYLQNFLAKIERFHPLVVVVSKSGGTVEPSVAFAIMDQYLQKRFSKKESISRTVLITDENKGDLYNLSIRDGYKRFVVPDNIGGRYSVLTAVSLVPLLLGGYPLKELMAGAADVFADFSSDNSSYKKFLNDYVGFRKKAWDEGKRIEVLAYNEPCLLRFSEWWKQLFAESEGKDGKGLFPTQMLYSTDLHSLGQYVQEGPRIVAETFLVFEDLDSSAGDVIEKRIRIPTNSSLLPVVDKCSGYYLDDLNKKVIDAAHKAHLEGGVPCFRLSVPRLNSYYLGSLIAFFQTACALSATLLQVDPFNQPGVEAYKENLKLSFS